MIKKAEISVQTFFFIFMVILMVAIMVYGINKLVFVEDVISKQEMLELKAELIDAFEYCEDPLNRGSFKSVEINNNLIDGVCVNDLIGDYLTNSELVSEFDVIKDSGDNVILLDGNNILDSFRVDFKNSFCYKRKKDLSIKIQC